MQNPDVPCCPHCKSLRYCGPAGLEYRPRIKLDDEGNARFLGYYWSCECGALTFSPSSSIYNLRNDVAETYAVLRMGERTVSARPPMVRRRVTPTF